MSQGWEASTGVGALNDWFTLHTTEEPLPQYDEGFILDFDESWLSAFVVDEVLPGPNSSHTQFNAGVTSFDDSAGCNADVDLDTLSLAGLPTPRMPSLNRLDCPSDLLKDGASERVNIVATDEQETKTESANGSCLFPTGKTVLGLSEESPPTRAYHQRPAKRSTSDKPKSKRTKISNEVRVVLDAHFDNSAYPTDGELVLLSGKTGLPVSVIKRWFVNARARKTMPEDNADADTNVDSQELHERPERSLSLEPVVGRDSLQDLDRCSPAPSVASLERYVNQTADQDSVPTLVIESALQADHFLLAPLVDAQSSKRRNTISKSRQQSPMRAFSTAGSNSSVGSRNSVRSSCSHISVDSRGSRRGRKRWTQPPLPPEAHRRKITLASTHKQSNGSSLHEKQNSNVPTLRSTRSYFCTWSSCNKSFPNRSAWARHEEAIHHCPYYWICCLDVKIAMRLPRCFVCGERDILLSHLVECHFSSCAEKPEECRTFVREDQLSQHIKGVHLDKGGGKSSIPKDVLSAWKKDNPSLLPSALICGFCGMIMDTWSQRQAHVFDHLIDGICKAAWWPLRLPFIPTRIPCAGPYTCSGCISTFANIQVAFEQHEECRTYSCRHIHDWHALFERNKTVDNPPFISCRLCGTGYPVPDLTAPGRGYIDDMRKHAEFHKLRECTQDIFADKSDFHEHMRICHGATICSTYAPWRVKRFLEQARHGIVLGAMLVTVNPFLTSNSLCDTNSFGFHLVY